MSVNLSKKQIREAFRLAVFSRDGQKCVRCGDPATDAHHILDRRLFPDGGYHLDNGASLCEECHWDAEEGVLTVLKLRELCGITDPPIPEGVAPISNKWGRKEFHPCPTCRALTLEKPSEALPGEASCVKCYYDNIEAYLDA